MTEFEGLAPCGELPQIGLDLGLCSDYAQASELVREALL